MRRILLSITLAVAASLLTTLQSACQSSTDNTNSTNISVANVGVAQPTPTIRPKPKPTPPEDQSIELVKAHSDGYIDYRPSGLGTSGEMSLRLENKTDWLWEVEIEVGTKLEPEDGDVQRMVITKEVHVDIHPHDHSTVKVETACLDISKLPPSQSNGSWTVERSPALAQFISCANGLVNEEKGQDPGHSLLYENIRPTIVQFSLWQARGASREQWIHFWVEYQNMTEDEARRKVDSMAPLLEEVVQRCPSLPRM